MYIEVYIYICIYSKYTFLKEDKKRHAAEAYTILATKLEISSIESSKVLVKLTPKGPSTSKAHSENYNFRKRKRKGSIWWKISVHTHTHTHIYNDCIEIDIGGGYDGYAKQLLVLAAYKIVEVEALVVHEVFFQRQCKSKRASIIAMATHTHHAIFRNQWNRPRVHLKTTIQEKVPLFLCGTALLYYIYFLKSFQKSKFYVRHILYGVHIMVSYSISV